MKLSDTITAISTPVGQGGIGVIRLSGSSSLNILKKCFKPKGKTEGEMESHKLYFGNLYDADGDIDEVCAVFMAEPKTYTRQDTAEISCHGSPAVLRRALRSLIKNGARMAQPGEFTKRAFLSGRIDLSQAEGVIDLIKARSEGAASAAYRLMEGGLSSRIDAVKQKLVQLLSNLEASIDFPDEELETASDKNLHSLLDKAISKMESLVRSYSAGKFLKHGVNIAIIGKPNVGKSSLLNGLTQEERAIVTPHPGTTRDTVHVETELAGLKVELIDTAGLNNSPGEIEAIGIERAFKAADVADIVIGVFDGSRKWDEEDNKVLHTLQKRENFLAVINKADLKQKLNWPEKSITPISISVKEEKGINGLLEKIKSITKTETDNLQEEPVVTRTRHLEIFQRINQDLKRAKEELKLGREVAAAGIWDALEEIKRFTGESYTDEVLSIIFDEFCIGK